MQAGGHGFESRSLHQLKGAGAAESEALMLYLAILLTIVSAILFAAGFGLAGYVIVTKIREYRQDSGSNSRPVDNPSIS